MAGLWRRAWPGGLRSRMVVVLTAVVVGTALAAAGVVYRTAAQSLVENAEKSAADSLRTRVETVAPGIGFEPEQRDLEILQRNLGERSAVLYGDLAAGEENLHLVSAEMRDAVERRREPSVQRVHDRSEAFLVVGTPIRYAVPDGGFEWSEVSVYTADSMAAQEEQLDRWFAWAALGLAGAAVAGVVLALFLARTVLRPVGELSRTAHRMVEGDLSVRAEPRGNDELSDLARTFNTASETLEANVEELRSRESEARRFAADASHELRTPLAALTASLDVVGRELEGGSWAGRDAAATAVDETRRLSALVSDLLDISQIDAGSARVRREPVDVHRTVRESIALRGWADQVRLSGRGPETAEVDVRRLSVIAANLVGNALRHGDPPVDVAVEVTQDEVAVSVTDHGPGIDPGAMDRVFSRFHKGDSSRSRSEGSGLGLAIALANARIQGGTIEVENAEGAGARFTFRLPRHQEGDSGEDE
ncbi:ATP-binding protein [Salininema proteolyticum]|uniref:histidine kinase n=1 Tax=Salininema proteolyticum TaxID=1607685 RepID=A0ABV8U0V4_9ACTN